ncbi:phosphate/phosphite/phosphonate ABC transporter substrate-binding protein [Marinobacter sp. F3R08]|nr:phosphate/phosphite/phosphonate ABC transporter substrate-binding protein [Marinobacter sp. F3R08]
MTRLGWTDVQEDQSLVLGVVPQQASEKLAREWLPLAKYLSEQVGFTVRFATAPDIPEFEKRMGAGEYDLAYMNPYHYTVFSMNPGYEALVRQRDHQIQGIIVVRSDRMIESLEELDGTSIAFPAPNAFAATLITRSFLDKAIADYNPSFVRSHDSVYRAVANGLFEAGGGIVRTFENMSPEIREKLEILWLSPGFTGHAFAVHPRVPEALKAEIREALVDFDRSERGREILEGLGMSGFQSASDNDWDEVRALDIRGR